MRQALLGVALAILVVLYSIPTQAGLLETITFGAIKDDGFPDYMTLPIPSGWMFTPTGSRVVGNVSKQVVNVQSQVRGAFSRAFGPEVADALLIQQNVSELSAQVGISFEHVADAVRRGQLNPDSYAAIFLAGGLRHAWERHIANSRPIPDDVKQLMLLGGMWPGVVENARYTVGNTEITLNNGINVLQNLLGNHYAVTTQNLIVFSRTPSASSKADVLWWAHELTHVFQYGNFGVERFAWEYMNHHDWIENGAANNAAMVWQQICQRQAHPDC